MWNPSSGRVERVPERSFGPVHRLPPSERYPERFGVTSNDLDREYVVSRRDATHPIVCMKYKEPEYRALLAAMKQLHDDGYEVRVVFWFDN